MTDSPDHPIATVTDHQHGMLPHIPIVEIPPVAGVYDWVEIHRRGPKGVIFDADLLLDEWSFIYFQYRLWSKIQKTSSCWIWKGAKTKHGYGHIWLDVKAKRTVLAHRAVYELLVGSIPKGLVLDHLCRNRLCVYPGHLDPVDTVENLYRGVLAVGADVVRQKIRDTCRRRRQAHCKHGHVFDQSNTRVGVKGDRHCITCEKLRGKARYIHHPRVPAPPQPCTECGRFTKNPRKGLCIACYKRGRRRTAREMGLTVKPGENQRRKTHCPHGHPYDETNTLRYRGERRCRTCMRAQCQRARKTKKANAQKIEISA